MAEPVVPPVKPSADPREPLWNESRRPSNPDATPPEPEPLRERREEPPVPERREGVVSDPDALVPR